MLAAALLAGAAAALACCSLASLAAGTGVQIKFRPRSGSSTRLGPVGKALIWLGRPLLYRVKAGRQRLFENASLLLLKAGSPLGISAVDLLAMKFGFAAVGVAGLVMVAGSGGGRVVTVLAAALPLLCFLIPDLYLKRAAATREERIISELPDFLDILRITVASGLPLQRSIEVTAARFEGMVAAEFLRVARAQRLGQSRSLALQQLSRRTQVEQLDAFVRAVDRAQRHGVSLTDTLLRQARAAREVRRRSIQERAAKAGPKVQLVVALLLVPAVLLLFAAAILARVLAGGGMALF